MSDELKLADHLASLGCTTGRSKSGRLLRVDNRESVQPLDEALLLQVIDCAALKELYLRGLTGFLNQHASALATLSKLKILDVEDSDLSDESVECFTACSALQVLNVRNTGVTDECVARLRKVMIGTRIIV